VQTLRHTINDQDCSGHVAITDTGLENVVLRWEIQVKVSFGEIIRMGNYSKCRKV